MMRAGAAPFAERAPAGEDLLLLAKEEFPALTELPLLADFLFVAALRVLCAAEFGACEEAGAELAAC